MKKLLHGAVLTGYLLLYITAFLAPYFNPEHFWYLSLLGLAFPYIVIAGIFLLALYFLASNRLRWILLAALIPGFFSLGSFFRFSSGAQPFDGGEQIKIVSYNVRSFNRYAWIKDNNVVPDIYRILANEHPDFIVLQEFFAQNQANQQRIVSAIKEQAGLEYMASFPPDKNNSWRGLCTFSKYPIQQVHHQVMSNGVNGYLETVVQHPKGTLRLVNFHLASYQLNAGDPNKKNGDSQHFIEQASHKLKNGMIQRAQQVRAMAQHLQSERTALPTLCAGDLNDTPHSYAYYKLDQLFLDSYEGAGSGEGRTYVGRLPGFRIDYVLHTEHFTALEYKSVKEEKSDHYPVSVLLAWQTGS